MRPPDELALVAMPCGCYSPVLLRHSAGPPACAYCERCGTVSKVDKIEVRGIEIVSNVRAPTGGGLMSGYAIQKK